MFFNIPTLFTWARIAAIPLIVGVFYWEGFSPAQQNLVATVMFVVFALTDWADGFLARKLNQTSAFGGIVALNAPLDAETAEEIVKIFTEVIIAPDATDAAKAIVAAKKNLRLLVTGGLPDPRGGGLSLRTVVDLVAATGAVGDHDGIGVDDLVVAGICILQQVGE